MSNNKVLSQSATKLTVSISEDSFFAALPATIAKFAGISYEGDNSTMRLERVTLNKQALVDRVKRSFRAHFASIHEMPEDENGNRAEKNFRLPEDIYNKIKLAVDEFVVSQLNRLNEGKWDVTHYARAFAYSSRADAYVEKASVTSELLIDFKRQKLAASIYISESERKLADLEKQNIADDDIRIVNARKRLDVAFERQAKLLRTEKEATAAVIS